MGVRDYLENGVRSEREYAHILSSYEKDEDIIKFIYNTEQAITMGRMFNSIPPFNIMASFEIAKHLISILKGNGYRVVVVDIPYYNGRKIEDDVIEYDFDIDRINKLITFEKESELEMIISDIISKFIEKVKSNIKDEDKENKLIILHRVSTLAKYDEDNQFSPKPSIRISWLVPSLYK